MAVKHHKTSLWATNMAAEAYFEQFSTHKPILNFYFAVFFLFIKFWWIRSVIFKCLKLPLSLQRPWRGAVVVMFVCGEGLLGRRWRERTGLNCHSVYLRKIGRKCYKAILSFVTSVISFDSSIPWSVRRLAWCWGGVWGRLCWSAVCWF